MACRVILLGTVLTNADPWQSRLWPNRLGQGKVLEMLLALGRAQPRGARGLLPTSQGR